MQLSYPRQSGVVTTKFEVEAINSLASVLEVVVPKRNEL